jgi:hypothetical protein
MSSRVHGLIIGYLLHVDKGHMVLATSHAAFGDGSRQRED